MNSSFNLCLILSLFLVTVQAEPDTIVLNRAEFRFPETHPGKVFVISKVAINEQHPLKKVVAVEPGFTSSLTPDKSHGMARRDALGRMIRSDSYASRIARIREKHALPVIEGRRSWELGLPRGANQAPENRYLKGANSRLVLLSNSPLIRTPSDLARLEIAEREEVRRKYGALSGELIQTLANPDVPDSLDVNIEFIKEHPGFIEGVKATLEERMANAHAWASAKPLVNARNIAQSWGLRGAKISKTGESLAARVLSSDLHQLAHDKNVVSIVRARPILQTALNRGQSVHYSSLLNAAYNPPGVMTHYGNRKIATLESGLSHQYVNCIDSDLRPDSYYVTANPGLSAHDEGMYHLLALGTPGSERHHLGNIFSQWYIFNAIKSDVIYKELDVLTGSFEGSVQHEAELDARVIDAFSYIAPYTLVVLSTANRGHDSIPANRSFSSLITGNVQHYNDANYTVNYTIRSNNADSVVNSSMSKNPLAKYGGSDDWELPVLIAPGFTPDSYWGLYDSCVLSNPSLGSLWETRGATSLSAPVLGAIAANVHGAFGAHNHPYAPLWTRAALLVTAENVDGYQAASYTDERDGFGTVSGTNAVIFAETAYEANVGGTAHVHGIATGIFDSSDFANFMPHVYNYKAPASFPSGKDFRIVLTWTSSPGVNTGLNEISDLALEATTDNWTWYADRINGNVETMNFEQPANNLAPNGEYQITIYPWTYRTAPDGPKFLYYSLAWTWVKEHAD